MNPKNRFLFLILFFGAAGAALVAAAGQGLRPDLVVSRMDFERVQEGTDAAGGKYWIFNVIVSVKNAGQASAGATKLLLERDNGGGGAYQQACPTCQIDVPALPAGRETTLPPRQFNNAMKMASGFRATADSGRAVAETNELNNALTGEFKAPSVAIVDKIPDIPRDKVLVLKSDLALMSIDFVNVNANIAGGVTTYTFDVVATIKNLGPGAAPSYGVLFQRAPVTDPKGSVPAGNAFQVLPALAANAQATATIAQTWTSGTPQRIYFINVDWDGKIAELSEGNNNGQKKTPWTSPRPADPPAGTRF